MTDIPKTILVVDDEESIREYAAYVLTRAGYMVLQAENGKKAINLFRQTPIDVMITDIVMPDGEGLETMSSIRKTFQKCGIIAMSGASAGGLYLDMASGLGADLTIQKPFDARTLLDAVRRALDRGADR